MSEQYLQPFTEDSESQDEDKKEEITDPKTADYKDELIIDEYKRQNIENQNFFLSEKEYNTNEPNRNLTPDTKELKNETTIKTVKRDFIQKNTFIIKKDPKDFNIPINELAQSDTISEPKIQIGIWPDFDKKLNFKFEKEAIDDYANKLIEQRILLLHCNDQEVGNEAIRLTVSKVINKKRLKEFEKKLLHFDSNGTNESSNQVTLNTLIQNTIASRKTYFIKVNLTSHDFLESLFFSNSENCHSVIEGLIQKRIFIICSVYAPSIIKKIESKPHTQVQDNKLFFSYFKIPFLPFLLKYHFNTKWMEYYEQINHQRGKGFWSIDNFEFHNEIVVLFKQGIHKFISELKHKDNPDFEKSVEENIKELPFSNEIHKSLLYIVTFFPRISVYNFRRLVSVVLGDKELVVNVVDKTQQQKPSNQETQTLEPVPQKVIRLYDLWATKGDTYLQECQIAPSQLESGSITFDFIKTYYREHVESHFQKNYPLFLQDQFVNVLNAGYFFELNVSRQLTDNLLQYIVRIATYDPNQYGANLLLQIFKKIFNPQIPIRLDKRVEDLNEEEQNKLKTYVQKEHIERKEGFARLTELMKLMLDGPEILIKQAILFLWFLFEQKAYFILLEIIKDLRHSAEINEHEWIRAILDQKDIGEKELDECISTLHWLARQNEYKIYDFLNDIRGWIDNEHWGEKYSTSQVHSLLFIFSIGDPLASHFPLRYYGEWPSKFALFIPFTTEKAIVEHWKYLIDWLFAPELKYAYCNIIDCTLFSDSIIEQRLAHIQTFIIESWWLIIKGIDDKSHDKLQSFALDRLFITLTEKLPLNQLKRLGKHWRMWANEYVQSMNKLKNAKKTAPIIISLYKGKRDTVRTLNKKIQEILKN